MLKKFFSFWGPGNDFNTKSGLSQERCLFFDNTRVQERASLFHPIFSHFLHSLLYSVDLSRAVLFVEDPFSIEV